MNWVLVFVLVTLAYNIWRGYHKGLLRIVYSLVAWLIVLIFVTWATPYINVFLMENTSIYGKIEARCEEKVRESAEQKAEEGLGGQNAALAELGVNLPDAAWDNIVEKTAGAAGELLESSGVYSQMARALADFVMEGISFFAALVGAWIIVHLISQVLGIVSKIPILKGVNRFFGVFAGGVYGLMLVWVAFYIVALGSTSELGRTIIAYIYESGFLKFLYENNLVLTMILTVL